MLSQVQLFESLWTWVSCTGRSIPYHLSCLGNVYVCVCVCLCTCIDPHWIHGSGRSPGEGNGNTLQYSCLENPMDRGAWRATVHGVTKNQIGLSNSHFHLYIYIYIYIYIYTKFSSCKTQKPKLGALSKQRNLSVCTDT